MKIIDRVNSVLSKYWLEALCILGGWTLYALLFFTHQYLLSRNSIGWQPIFISWLIGGLCWALVTPLIVWLARRFILSRSHWLMPIIIHLVMGLVFPNLVYLLAGLVYPLLMTGRIFFSSALYWSRVQELYPIGVLNYWIVVSLIHFIDYFRKYKERELRAAHLEMRLTQAQLQALKMQLNPHFLFNTLNSISVLMRKDVEAADRMLLQLSNFFRLTLTLGGANEIPLAREIEFLEHYIEIEKTRYQDRLSIHIDVDPQAQEALVPHLILQPLVENAIRYGIAELEGNGLIEISIERRNGSIQLQVRDNGPGVADSQGGVVEGIGLSNTRARLQQLYGSASHFEFHNLETGGFVVTAKIPFHHAAILP